MPSYVRDYHAIAAAVRPQSSREKTMRHVVDVVWDHLREQGVSWVGFYLDRPNEPEQQRMILGPCRDSPACSPIGLHGVCGQALLQGRTRIVEDVAELGPSYIACDPRDRSEIVVPLIDGDNQCWGVLDLDSWDVGSFSDQDDVGLRDVLTAAGLFRA